MSDQLFYLFSATLFGIVIGAFAMYYFSHKNGSSSKSVEEIEEKLNNYQQDVVNHFEKTADLVEDLTQSYKKVFDHLGSSAKDLMTEKQLQFQIEKRKGNKVTLEFLNVEEDAGEVEVIKKDSKVDVDYSKI